jgi:hypothetical protein
MSLDVSAAASILKETYPNGIVDIDYSRAKTLALLKKSKGTLVEGDFGTAFKVPIKYGGPQAGSATFATGYNQAATESTRYTHWYLVPAELFQFARVSGALVRRSQGPGAFVKALVSEIENAKLSLTRYIEMYLDGDGFGALGQVGSISGTTITLADASQVRFFEIGMTICASSSNAGAVLRAPTVGKYTKITARSVSAGTITTAGDMSSGGTPVVANDYLFRYGDREDASSPTRQIPTGFAGFLPDTAGALSASFFGVNQTLTERLGGLRSSATTSGSLEEAILDMSSDIDAQGGQTTHAVMGSATFTKLGKSLLNKVWADVEDQQGMKLGVKGIVIQGASGDILCYGDSAFKETRARLFDINDVGIQHTQSDLVKLENMDGLQFRQIEGTDDWMARIVASYQFHVDAPGHAGAIINM